MEKSYSNVLETLLLIYAADGGELKIYLKKKADEPYKGYWTLPSAPLDSETTLEENGEKIYEDTTGLKEPFMKQALTFSDLKRHSDARIIGQTFIVVTDKTLTDIKKEGSENAWFEVNELPKLGFDHEHIIKTVTKMVKDQIATNHDDILLAFFQSDFTLPELQHFYESVLGVAIDRRNFHKKFVGQGLVHDTGFKTSRNTGRPGTLYRFNPDKMKGKRL